MITSYLEVAVGDYIFLLASSMVREVWHVAHAPEVSEGMHSWRGHACALTDCRTLLGVETSKTTAWTLLAYGEGDTPLILVVDRIVTLRRLDDDALYPLPTSLAPLNCYVDRIFWPDAEGCPMLRWSRLSA
jgi:chemotaxis signal transduction protein